MIIRKSWYFSAYCEVFTKLPALLLLECYVNFDEVKITFEIYFPDFLPATRTKVISASNDPFITIFNRKTRNDRQFVLDYQTLSMYTRCSSKIELL